MSPIRWDETLVTGDPAVDHQHRAIHRLLDELEQSSGGPAEIMRVLDFLSEHVLVHFTTEEDLMRREHFPAELTAAHIAEHKLLTDAVRDHILEFRCGTLTSAKPLASFLREWLCTHVHACDRQLVEHVRGRGVAAQLPAEWFIAEQRASA